MQPADMRVLGSTGTMHRADRRVLGSTVLLAAALLLSANGVSAADICGLNITSVTVSLRSLEGIELSVATLWDTGYTEHKTLPKPSYNKPFPDYLCLDCGEGMTGLSYDVLEEAASRGGFTLKWDLHRDIDSSKGETYTNLARNFTDDHDIAGDFWTDSVERRLAGLSIGYYYLDDSRVIVSPRPTEKTAGAVEYAYLLAPFSADVWLMLLVLVISHAIAMVIAEYHHDAERRGLPKGAATMHSLWMSFERFTGGDHHSKPRTVGGRLIMTFYGLFCLLFLAIYTANLAAFIVIEQAGTEGAFYTVEDLQYASASALIFDSDPLENAMTNVHPFLNFVDTKRGETSIASMLEGSEASVIIFPFVDAQRLVRSQENCDYMITGNVVSGGAGFATRLTDCKLQINVVLDVILLDMFLDGTLKRIINKYRPDQCSAALSASTLSTKLWSLNLKQVGILYIVTGGGILVIVVGIFAKRAKYGVGNVDEEDSDDESVEEEVLLVPARKSLGSPGASHSSAANSTKLVCPTCTCENPVGTTNCSACGVLLGGSATDVERGLEMQNLILKRVRHHKAIHNHIRKLKTDKGLFDL